MNNPLQGQDFITIRGRPRRELERILDHARRMEQRLEEGESRLAEGCLMGTLFFEPSTRTRLSFQAAMSRLGGDSIGFSSAGGTSVQKGETLADTLRTVEQYVDLIVLRHPSEGAARLASAMVEVPVINAGDGGANHPTQTLLDLYTIRAERGSIDGARIALAGDLRYSRTTRSLARALAEFDVEILLYAPEQLTMRKDLMMELEEKGIQPREMNDLEEALRRADLVYATRIQKERFPDEAEYNKVARAYQITRELVERCGHPLVLHPLPRVHEIHPDVDELDNAVYFDQAGYGVPVRMALISLLLDRTGEGNSE